MPEKVDPTRIHKIDGVNIASPIDLDSDLANKKAKGENKGIVYYAVDKESGLERIFDTLLDTIAGKNKAGKGLGKIKDVITWILPELKPVDVLTDEIGDLIKSKRTKNNIMKQSKPSPQPSTVKGITIFVSLLALVGVHLDAVAVSTAVSGIITGLSLAIPAGISLWEMIRDEVF